MQAHRWLSRPATTTARSARPPASPPPACAGSKAAGPGAAPWSAATTAAPRTGTAPPAPPPGTAPEAARAASAVVLHVLQERVILVEHDHALAVGKGCAVGLQAAVERVERRVGTGRLRVQPRGLGVALATQPLCVALGLGHDHRLVAVGLRTHGARLLLAL